MYLIKINGEIKMINGIKPAMKTTTKLRIKPTSFDEAMDVFCEKLGKDADCLLYTSPSPRDTERSRMPSSA